MHADSCGGLPCEEGSSLEEMRGGEKRGSEGVWSLQPLAAGAQLEQARLGGEQPLVQPRERARAALGPSGAFAAIVERSEGGRSRAPAAAV